MEIFAVCIGILLLLVALMFSLYVAFKILSFFAYSICFIACFVCDYFDRIDERMHLKYKEFKMYQVLEPNDWGFSDDYDGFKVTHLPTSTEVDFGFFRQFYVYLKFLICETFAEFLKKLNIKRDKKVEVERLQRDKEMKFLTYMSDLCDKKTKMLEEENKEINLNINREIAKIKEVASI